MCGIAGILSFKTHLAPARHQLEAMSGLLRHRGPDGSGYYLKGPLGLAHTRLSIIDLQTGSQPIHNEDGTVWMVFNGEIFNYIELRAELIQQGHRFYTDTDSEVIVHLYEQHGDEFVHFLNGQFAIALWDETKHRLLLIRDRVGIAPLFYRDDSARLTFASEVKALLAVDEQSPQMNADALDQIMTFWAPVSPNTLFAGVKELAPGTMLVVTETERHIKTYWDWQFPLDAGDLIDGPEDAVAEQLLELLIDATRIRLRSDVPVGAYLSGGLDSSIITSLIHHFSDTPLRTFSIGFDSREHDESAFQQQMVNHLNTDHSRIQCGDHDVAANFMDTIWHTESTILRTAPTPMKMLSKAVSQQNYKVVLTGEGADEVFGGYDIFKEAKVRQFWSRQPQSAWRPLLLKKLYPYLDMSSSRAPHYLQRFFGNGLDHANSPFFAHLPRWETTAKSKAFFSDQLRHSLADDAQDRLRATLPDALGQWPPFHRWQHIESKSLMSGYLLCSQGDRMLMANSVEGRFPFLDHRVIEFANRLSPRLKMKVLNEKYLLKRATQHYLPDEITARHKQPYRAPDSRAFYHTEQQQASADYVDELLTPEKIADYGYFDPKKVSMLAKKARRGGVTSTKDNQAFIGVLSTQIWHYHFIEKFHHNFNFRSKG